jgi:hypothetical protein
MKSWSTEDEKKKSKGTDRQKFSFVSFVLHHHCLKETLSLTRTHTLALRGGILLFDFEALASKSQPLASKSQPLASKSQPLSFTFSRAPKLTFLRRLLHPLLLLRLYFQSSPSTRRRLGSTPPSVGNE